MAGTGKLPIIGVPVAGTLNPATGASPDPDRTLIIEGCFEAVEDCEEKCRAGLELADETSPSASGADGWPLASPSLSKGSGESAKDAPEPKFATRPGEGREFLCEGFEEAREAEERFVEGACWTCVERDGLFCLLSVCRAGGGWISSSPNGLKTNAFLSAPASSCSGFPPSPERSIV